MTERFARAADAVRRLRENSSYQQAKTMLLDKLLFIIVYAVLSLMDFMSLSPDNYWAEVVYSRLLWIPAAAALTVLLRARVPSLNRRAAICLLMLLLNPGFRVSIFSMLLYSLFSVGVILLEKNKLPAAALVLTALPAAMDPAGAIMLFPFCILLCCRKTASVRILNTVIPRSACLILTGAAAAGAVGCLIAANAILGSSTVFAKLIVLSRPLTFLQYVLAVPCFLLLRAQYRRSEPGSPFRMLFALCCIFTAGGWLLDEMLPVFIALIAVFCAVLLNGFSPREAYRSFRSTTDLAAFRKIALITFLIFVALFAWNCDDAYHSYVMSEHLIHGKGLVYSTGYRTTASTCPLMTLLQAAVLLICRNTDLCNLIIGLVSCGVAGYYVFYRFCKTRVSVTLSAFAMICSYSFLCFTTSGLENCLLFCFGAILLDLFLHCPQLNRKQLFVIALMMSLLAAARTDSVLIFIPAAVWAYLFRSKVPFWQRVLIGIGGLLPFAGWTLFSLIYYGFPFPNTFYAKLYTGFPASDYLIRGLFYLGASWLYDPLMLLVPLAFLVLTLRLKDRSGIILGLGIAAYAVYLLKIGGDFMLGRHLTLQFFCAVCGTAYLAEKYDIRGLLTAHRLKSLKKGFAAAGVLTLILCGALWHEKICPRLANSILNLRTIDTTYLSALDERVFYVENKIVTAECIASCVTGRPTAFSNRFRVPADRIRAECLTGEGIRGTCTELGPEHEGVMMSGYAAYLLNKTDDFYLTDNIALPDPLLSHLRATHTKYWRVGHMTREIPAGYAETLRQGVNLIEDPSLHQYYDKLLLIMTGDLFDSERIQTIIDINLGRYDYLLAEYESRRPAQPA